MEKPGTNDDLNERIQGWRKTLLGRPGIGETDVDELESHLRDTVDRLTAAALTREEAFLVAAHRIGSPAELEDQYSAVNVTEAWKTRVIWMITGVLGYWTVMGVSGVLAKLTLVVGAERFFTGISLARWGILIYLVLMVAFGCLLFMCLRRQISRGTTSYRANTGNGSLWLIVWLAIASLAASLANESVNVLATKFQGPATLGSYFLFSSYFVGPVSYLTVVGFGVWFARRKSRQIRQAGTIVSVLILLATVGCSPDTKSNSKELATVSTNAPTTVEQMTEVASASGNPVSTNPDSASAPAGSSTAFEQCMAMTSSSPVAAVDAFLKLDLASGALFTFGSPLSYSEAQFANLPSAVREKVAAPMTQDLLKIKKLVDAAKSRRDQARAGSDTKTADQFSKQLAALGTRLQDNENLKLTQLTGVKISKIATQ